jgi:hypothetical protein
LEEIHPFVGEQKWLVPHLTFDLLEGCQKHPQNMTFNTWESFKQKLETLSFSLSVDGGGGDSIFLGGFLIAKSGCCHFVCSECRHL